MKTILAFDDFVLNRSDNTRRVFKQPEWRMDLLYTDPAAPRRINLTGVVPAPQGGYMMIYLAVPGVDMPENDEHLGIFMAWSPDGLRFEPYPVKPGEAIPHLLGYTEEELGTYVCYDAGETNPEFRYKSPQARYGNILKDKLVQEPAYLLGSPDLVRWKRISDAPVTPSYVDCYPSFLRNPITGRYQVTTRRRWGERRVCLVESEDLSSWTIPRGILHPTPFDEPTTHYYSMPHYYYEPGEVFIGFLWKQVMPFNEIMNGPVRTEYAYSYDGLMWNQTGASLFPAVPRGEYGGGSCYVQSMIDKGDEILVYANLVLTEHGGWPEPWKPGMPSASAFVPGVLKRNRFVAIDAGKGRGELITQWLRLKKPELRLNANVPFGSLKAELRGGSGPLEGYSLDDFLGFEGDRLEEPLRWKGGGLERFVEEGKWLRLHIVFEQAEVYAVTGDFDFTINTRAPAYEHL